MFDLGWSEFLIISVVTIVVVGPKEIPRVIRTVSGGVRKARAYAADFQKSVMEVADMDDLDDMRKTLTAEKESLNQNMSDAKADMDAIRKQWEMDWEAEPDSPLADSVVNAKPAKSTAKPKKANAKKNKAKKMSKPDTKTV